ncbi:ProQ/FINO family protein [Litchfieldella xinjiangensis]|uniref:ProQ/FINO family protein n=1 Tax=Litchfieldella xinjiangensis TaxID=1166948 RepID=UPI0006931EB5|nr:ProQ/FINO family protein [Halomonas xinjiangensis]
MIPQLLDTLEQRADRWLLQLLDARAKVRMLEARNRELQATNAALAQELDALKAEVRQPHVTAGRSQGLAALMARRPRHATAHEPEPDQQPASQEPAMKQAPLEQTPQEQTAPVQTDASAPEATATPQPAGAPVAEATPPASATMPPANAPERSDEVNARQGSLSIGEAPSPQALLDEWYRRYTDTFFKGHTRPLKIGIHEDLMQREPWPEKLVRRALASYVHLPRYLKAVRAGTERVGLNGEPAGTVTEGEAKYAKKQLDELQAQNRSRQAQRREKQRQQEKDTRLEQKLSQLLAKHDR